MTACIGRAWLQRTVEAGLASNMAASQDESNSRSLEAVVTRPECHHGAVIHHSMRSSWLWRCSFVGTGVSRDFRYLDGVLRNIDADEAAQKLRHLLRLVLDAEHHRKRRLLFSAHSAVFTGPTNPRCHVLMRRPTVSAGTGLHSCTLAERLLWRA